MKEESKRYFFSIRFSGIENQFCAKKHKIPTEFIYLFIQLLRGDLWIIIIILLPPR